MSFLISTPFPGFLDSAGDPLENGKIYIGQPNLNAQNFPQTAYWDAALTIPAAQPIRTSGGYPWLNGSPAKVFVAGTYSIIVKDKNDQLVYSDPSAGIAGLVSGMLSGTVSDLNFDPTALGMIVDETRILVSTLSPANPPDVAGGTYYTIQLTKVSSSEYRVLLMQGTTPGNLYIRSYAAGLWGAWNPVGSSYLALTTGSSPYTVTAWGYNTLEVNAITNPYVINLPSGSTCSGYRLRIINTSALATGLIKINPFAGDKIGPLPVSTAIYLQNVDQSAWANGKKEVELVSDGTGTWAVEGQWMPEPGSVDAAGSQYYLGRLRRLPLGNATSRNIGGSPGGVGTFTASSSVTTVGVPTGAKAILARVIMSLVSTAPGTVNGVVVFSDNITTIPTANSAHSSCSCRFLASAPAESNGAIYECVLPLDVTGKVQSYNLTQTNVTVFTSAIIVIGYYMGD
jgi:hypothetical protein